jgi:hypothetical protein
MADRCRKAEMAGRRKAKRKATGNLSGVEDNCLKSRERNWFTEGSVRWEGWDIGAARPCHRPGREKFLLARLGMLGGVRLAEGSGYQCPAAAGGQPGAGVGRSRRSRNSAPSQSPWAGCAGGSDG